MTDSSRQSSKQTKHNTKYIFVVGGVMSGVGKGVASSSLGKILQFHGLNVSAIKIDPYVNVDAGTMNPTEHGEVFVLDDGYETDQDMGNYERFLNKSLTSDSYMTTGSVYQKVIADERALKYKGKCVDVVPHVPLSIIEQIKRAARLEQADVMLVEIGGTLGEYQNILFLEAARMMKNEFPQDVAYILVSYLPSPQKVGEMKTKPTQYAVRTMAQSGLIPDIIIGRSEVPMDAKRKEKIAFSCSINPKDVISAPDIDSIYDVPENFMKEGLDDRIMEKLGIKKTQFRTNNKAIDAWNDFVKKSKNGSQIVKIAIVGKYFDTGDFVLSDAYLSVIEALKFSAYKVGVKPELHWINSKHFEGAKPEKDVAVLAHFDGVLVPGGFGQTGIEGKIKAIQYAREQKIPYFGICYGMQLAAIEYARNKCGIKDATTYELDPNPDNPNLVVTILPEQLDKMEAGDFGGSMRLGAYPANIVEGSLAANLYGDTSVSERHRHRYELNPDFESILTKAGMRVSGRSPDGRLPEIIELDRKEHPFFIGVQFHPELKARPLDPHPIFTGFVKACAKGKTNTK
ncbi:MAG: CTP synthase [Patescibacteria group bacterium]